MREQKAESIDHLVSGCSIRTPIEYKSSNDEIGHCILWNYVNIIEHLIVKMV